jgi:alkylation response protein AidB-like acyl-CoA dehydrogenase
MLRQLVEHANTTTIDGRPLAADPAVRRRLARMATEIAALRLMFYRAACLIRDEASITYETAVAKIMADETGQRFAQLGVDLLGLWSLLRAGSPLAKLGGALPQSYLTSLGHTIAGGTAEILRTTVAVRGLGLPAARG